MMKINADNYVKKNMIFICRRNNLENPSTRLYHWWSALRSNAVTHMSLKYP